MKIKDSYGNSYEIDKKLSSGGQGIVYTLKNNRNIVLKYLVKPNTEEIVVDNNLYDEFEEKIMKIISLDISNGIATPIVMLERPNCGYIMRLMDGMESLEKIMVNKPEPKTLESFIEFYEWYEKSGGLKRRLLIANKLAHVLNDIHSKGILYADLSPKNVFISKNINDNEVWLIDSDNLRYENDFLGEPILSPCYFPPELLNDEMDGVHHNTIKGDCYSFALLIYELLTSCKPFEGNAVLFPEKEDWELEDDELGINDQVDRGLVPWINDTNDSSNEGNGIFGFNIFNDNIKQAFIETFENGKLNPTKRTSMKRWCDILDDALRNLKICDGNKIIIDGENNFYHKSHYYLGDECHICRAKSKRVLSLIEAFDVFVLESDNETVEQIESVGTQLIFRNEDAIEIDNKLLGRRSDIPKKFKIIAEKDEKSKEIISYKIITENIPNFEVIEKNKKVTDGIETLDAIQIVIAEDKFYKRVIKINYVKE